MKHFGVSVVSVFLLSVIFALVCAQSPPPYAFSTYFSTNMHIVTEDFEIISLFHANYETNEEVINIQYQLNSPESGKPKLQLIQQSKYFNLTSSCEYDYNFFSQHCLTEYQSCQCSQYFRAYLPIPQYPIGIPTSNFTDKVNGVESTVYYNDKIDIAFAVDKKTEAPVALIAAYGTNDQTIYYFTDPFASLPANVFDFPCPSESGNSYNFTVDPIVNSKPSFDLSSLFNLLNY